jgi:hypothetical protein
LKPQQKVQYFTIGCFHDREIECGWLGKEEDGLCGRFKTALSNFWNVHSESSRMYSVQGITMRGKSLSKILTLKTNNNAFVIDNFLVQVSVVWDVKFFTKSTKA